LPRALPSRLQKTNILAIGGWLVGPREPSFFVPAPLLPRHGNRRANASRFSSGSREPSHGAGAPRRVVQVVRTGKLLARFALRGKARLHSGNRLRHNPSLERTHSGVAYKPAVWLFQHVHTPGLHATPPRSAQLER
jgi:hypothetical protein